MSNYTLPAEVEDLRLRTREFIRTVVRPAEPRPGGRLDQATRDRLQRAAREAGVFAPHVPREFGGQGVPIQYWSPIFQEAGYSPIGPCARDSIAPAEGQKQLSAAGLPFERDRPGPAIAFRMGPVTEWSPPIETGLVFVASRREKKASMSLTQASLFMASGNGTSPRSWMRTASNGAKRCASCARR